MCKFGSIREIHHRLKEEGYSVSEYFLRQLVKCKKIPAVYIGTKAMISYEQVVQFLESAPLSA